MKSNYDCLLPEAQMSFELFAVQTFCSLEQQKLSGSLYSLQHARISLNFSLQECLMVLQERAATGNNVSSE